jgi:hypothetical protein
MVFGGAALAGGCSPAVGCCQTRIAWSVNGNRVVIQTSPGVTRRLETNGGVTFRDGQPAQVPPGGVLRLTEKRGNSSREAELRQLDGTLQWWVKADQRWRAATAGERAAWEGVLQALALDDRDATEIVQNAVRQTWPQAGLHEALRQLDEIGFSSGRTALLMSLLGERSLTAQDQTAVVEAVFRGIDFDSERQQLLLAAIARTDLADEVKQVILKHLDDLSFDSTRIEVMRALLKRMTAASTADGHQQTSAD